MVAGWWDTVNFESQFKIVLGETFANGVPIHKERKNKFKTRICIIIPNPYNI